MSGRDVFEFINEQDAATLQSLINRLEFRGNDPTFIGYRESYVERMGISSSAAILDVGCGTGVLARALARRPGFSGSSTALDQSRALVEAARRLASEEGLPQRIDRGHSAAPIQHSGRPWKKGSSRWSSASRGSCATCLDCFEAAA
jgi:SAM-dependent methyltransferase